MRIPFCQLTVETEIEGILEIRGFELKEALNSHAFLRMECLLDEDFWERAVSCATKDSSVRVCRGEEILFFWAALWRQDREGEGKMGASSHLCLRFL